MYWALGYECKPVSREDFEIQMFTGLEDRKGVGIYESDLIALGGETYKVNFRSGCFMADNIKNGKTLWHEDEDIRVWHTLMESQMLIEVIGNIFELTSAPSHDAGKDKS